MYSTAWVGKVRERTLQRVKRSVPFSHVDPQFATPTELFPSHPTPVYPHLHQLLPQRTPPEYHCAKPSGTTRVKTTIKSKDQIKTKPKRVTREFTFLRVIKRSKQKSWKYNNGTDEVGKEDEDYVGEKDAAEDSTCSSVLYPELLV